jgi:ferredoxin-NADP reductase
MAHIVKIKSIQKITPDVLQIVVEKPSGFTFNPGQAADISINKNVWKDQKNPFTFTSLPEDDHVEFTIKTYPSHKGVTNELLNTKAGEELIIHDVFGDIGYKGEGVFIAGGAGITPFISIFRYLQSKNLIGNNKLVFANKMKTDIIHEEMFTKLLGKNFINVLSDEILKGYEHGYITAELLQDYITPSDKYFYLCGPPPMMNAVEKHLTVLHVDPESIVKEGF